LSRIFANYEGHKLLVVKLTHRRKNLQLLEVKITLETVFKQGCTENLFLISRMCITNFRKCHCVP